MAGRRPVPGKDPVVQYLRQRAAGATRGLRCQDPGVLGVHIGHGFVPAASDRNYSCYNHVYPADQRSNLMSRPFPRVSRRRRVSRPASLTVGPGRRRCCCCCRCRLTLIHTTQERTPRRKTKPLRIVAWAAAARPEKPWLVIGSLLASRKNEKKRKNKT